ncbi:type II toxin-antitoxin system VapC family toxin [Limnohabitans sp. Jir72]|uniref:type II toxin-antitoxin system VapC family toxin n=1 Tax=Limnohabitans sp. Jir72 TaxID=1977909 RepID=UPI000D34C3D6|nr:type II toxin-antitoxin system VapC family toxin [Limnohabitans sp. Jir72]PUE34237.1 VapC toxin family PIN domain ribonuclease [Limnohabitans sp. Jir72]
MSAGFLIDTHVLSELMRENPAPQVLAWFASQNANLMQTSAITHAEILAGIALLPAGKRREAMAQAAGQIFDEDFSGRCIDFGGQAIGHYALVRAQRQLAGRPIDTADAQIAAIALAAKLTLVTRNTKDFECINDLQVINPWLHH